MADYIERTEELILAVNAGARAIENNKRYHGTIYNMDVFSNEPKEIPYLQAAEVLRMFDEIPAADVTPVVHGRWERNELFAPYCTVCECSPMSALRPEGNYHYCPNCGAKMDGDT